MPDFHQSINDHADMSEDAQKKAGQVTAGDMGDEHKNFLKTVIDLLDSGKLDVTKPETFLHKDVYDGLDEEWQSKTDQAMINIADQLRHIKDFHDDPSTPDSAPQLQVMIEHLWQMKQRIEDHYDVFIF